MTAPPDTERLGAHRWTVVLILTVAKTFVITISQVVYPFESHFSEELGLTTGRFFLYVAVGEIVGAVTPAIGGHLQRFSSGSVLVVTLFVTALTTVAMGALLDVVAGWVVGWLAFNLVKTALLGSHSAYIGDEVPVRHKANVMGLTEMSFGASSFLGLPFAGLLIDYTTPHQVFIVMGVIMAVCSSFVFLAFRVHARREQAAAARAAQLPAHARQVQVSPAAQQPPADDTPPADDAHAPAGDKEVEMVEVRPAAGAKAEPEPASPAPAAVAAAAPADVDHGLSSLWHVLKNRRAQMLCLACICTLASFIMVFGSYAPWLEDEHGLSASELGGVSVVIGVAGALGELTCALLGSRFGLRRQVAVTLVLCSVMPLLLIAVEKASLTVNMVALFLVFYSLELTVVQLLGLGTQYLLGYQTTLFTLIHAAIQVGRFVAAVIVSPLWDAGGLPVAAAVAAGFGACAFLSMLVLLRLGPEPEDLALAAVSPQPTTAAAAGSDSAKDVRMSPAPSAGAGAGGPAGVEHSILDHPMVL